MLGLGSLASALAVWLTLALCVLCIGYGIVKWNDAGKPDKMRPSDD
jgi:hypothetical protein